MQCEVRDETVNQISECSKPEYEKVIHWELCKRLNLGHMNKCYVRNLESVPVNKTHKILLDFEI